LLDTRTKIFSRTKLSDNNQGYKRSKLRKVDLQEDWVLRTKERGNNLTWPRLTERVSGRGGKGTDTL
jgi:hypothetical protein